MELVKGAAGKGPTGAGADVLSALLVCVVMCICVFVYLSSVCEYDVLSSLLVCMFVYLCFCLV